MATTHVVALFLPNTLNFYDEPEKEDNDATPKATTPTSRAEKRNSSTMNLMSRSKSAVSLLSYQNLRLTPGSDDVFGPLTGDSQQRRFATPGNPRSLLHTDAEVCPWGSEQVFNQPRSKARPLPSGALRDFAKANQEINQQKDRASRGVKSPPQRTARNTSSEHGYGDKSFTVEAPLQGNGGLVNAVRSAQKLNNLEVSWIGTLGFPTDVLPAHKRQEISDHLINEYQEEVVYVSDKDLQGHYIGYCKTILWPIFNYQIPDHPKSKAYADHSWDFYRNVNQAFANRVVDSYKRGDIIWIHDYHLLLVPGLVREKLPEAQIGFFLHTAFPSSEVFRILPKRKELLEGILGANLVAFQTNESTQHFLQTCNHLLTLEITSEGVKLPDDGRFINVTSQPIGINPLAIQEAQQAEEVQEWVKTVQERYKGKYILVARDKLDDLHGVKQKLLAYELFLSKYPQFAEKTVLIQVATSTSEQTDTLTEASAICARIDGKYSSLVCTPLVFLMQDIEFSQYLALLTIADALIISSCREGMNLTAHEYVVCQGKMNGVKKYSPLILSEFTGAAAILEGQINVNPWNYRQTADAMKQALEMDDAEKESRWKQLYAVVSEHTGGRWAEQLSNRLAKVHEEHNMRVSTTIPRLSTTLSSEKYKRSKQRLFIIDYEGTLAPRRTEMAISLSQPQRIVETLNELMADSKNVVYVMSGSGIDVLDSVFRSATGLGLIAENGCFVKEFGASEAKWQSFVDLGKVEEWKRHVKMTLYYYLERMEGSYTKERQCSIIFHYEKVEDQVAASRQAGECANTLNESCKSLGVQAVPLHKSILVEHMNYNKAAAAKSIFNTLCEKMEVDDKDEIDFLMVAGDDREDEVAFRWANELDQDHIVQNIFTVSVGKRNTEARTTVDQGSSGLLAVLQKMAKISLEGMPVDYFNMPRKDKMGGRGIR